jgi:flavin reductase (DIM6/NTAB) family NADH-FMN oxidoreductase RutF
MYINLKEQTNSENYNLLIGSILPRPIAFITSENENGVVNGAPFSFFNVVCANPPLVSIAIGRKKDGSKKDTSRNILNQKEFVIHTVDRHNVKQINDCSADYSEEISEIEKVGFTLCKSKFVSVPSIKEANVKLECIYYNHMEVGGSTEEPAADLIIGEVVGVYVDDKIWINDEISTAHLKPVGRLARTDYTEINEMFAIPRPTLSKE